MIKSSPSINSDLVRTLADLLVETDLTEIEVEQDQMRIRVARTPVRQQQNVTLAPAPVAAPQASDSSKEQEKKNVVSSPMVGTVYLAPEPGAEPFVTVGMKVRSGDKLLIIEAMKVMNLITAQRDGTVAAVLVEDGQPVEYDEHLIILE